MSLPLHPTQMVHTIDLHFLGNEQAIASYLIETNVGPILIETGPHSTFSTLKKGIEKLGFRLEDIKHVFLTHIHLDHAGAAWAFAETGAKIYVHPFGLQHLLDPGKLMASAARIYQDQMERLWGTMKAIPEDQLIAVDHKETISLGEHEITSWHTPGHATHHIAWQFSTFIMSGDVGGVKINNGIVVPPCPPPDINLEDWSASIELIKKLNPTSLYLTHYGKVDKPNEHLDALEKQLYDWANWMKPKYEAGEAVEKVVPEFQAYVKQQLHESGIVGAEYEKYEAANPSWMSVAGLMRYWKKKLSN